MGRVGRVRGRDSFRRLAGTSQRAVAGGVRVARIGASEGAPTLPAVAYAVSRRHGSAVQRNRIRRRLRAAVEDLAGSGLIGSGRYLVSPRRAPVVEIPYEELKCDLTTAFSKLEGR